MSAGLDWAGLMQVGLHGLRLTPDQFWRLTPAELALMLGQRVDLRPLGRSGFDALLRAFPDGPQKEPDR
ncbi:MAG: putative phage protein (TIGR02216 family) [Loktanella salsilacus]|jgi:uncharacterized phage protein (TIGR02216 family)|uniref:rcc01693 family protein n=1 Tax=Loktanella salsilacus TaxID=195913 RepID=UPI003989EB27